MRYRVRMVTVRVYVLWDISASLSLSVCLSVSLSLSTGLQGHLPFAVVGSTEEVKIGNKMVKARQYPWGTVQGKPGSRPPTGNEEGGDILSVQTHFHSPSPKRSCPPNSSGFVQLKRAAFEFVAWDYMRVI